MSEITHPASPQPSESPALQGSDSAHRLYRDYPLPKGWAPPRAHVMEFKHLGLDMTLIGLETSNETSGQGAFGSAGGREGVLSRAYFELVERVAIIEALQSGQQNFDLVLCGPTAAGRLPRGLVFPTSPDESVWRHALSSGVATGHTASAACEAAALELIERDHVLRSWYGEFAPRLMTNTYRILQGGKTNTNYEVFTYAIGQTGCNPLGAHVVATFAFPVDPIRPLAYGFGAGLSQAVAIEKSLCEMTQRLGFLWDEEVPRELPPFSASPHYHQDYYLCPLTRAELTSWLDGGRRESGLALNVPLTNLQYCDLTPTTMRNKLHVVKAVAENAVPLTFGRWNPLLKPGYSQNPVHPIA